VSITQVFPDFVATGMHARLITRDGTITGKNTTVDYSKVMNTEKAAALILNAAAKRKRELIMSSRGRVGMWLKLIAPRMLDNIARRGIQQGR
jgi:short-subunit dehydrogenase